MALGWNICAWVTNGPSSCQWSITQISRGDKEIHGQVGILGYSSIIADYISGCQYTSICNYDSDSSVAKHISSKLYRTHDSSYDSDASEKETRKENTYHAAFVATVKPKQRWKLHGLIKTINRHELHCSRYSEETLSVQEENDTSGPVGEDSEIETEKEYPASPHSSKEVSQQTPNIQEGFHGCIQIPKRRSGRSKCKDFSYPGPSGSISASQPMR